MFYLLYFHYSGRVKRDCCLRIESYSRTSHSTFALSDAPTAGLRSIASAVSFTSYHLPFTFCLSDGCIVVKRLDFRARRTPPLSPRLKASDVLGSLHTGRKCIVAALFGRIRRLRLGVNLERHTLTLLNLQPRRVRSHCRASPAGRFERYFCGQFSVCLFRIRGREPRSIFPLAKVGLTVQRKTSRRIYCINF